MNSTKKANELEVARIFCDSCTIALGKSCTDFAPCEPPAADFLICVGGGLVSLELARYRETGPHNDADSADLDLKAFLLDLFRRTGLDRLPRCMVRMTYRHGPVGQFLIPRANDRPAFGEEILTLLKTCRVREHGERSGFRFVPADKVATFDRLEPAVRHIAVDRYELLARFCDRIDLLWDREVPIGLPSSSMNARGTAIDFTEIDRLFRKKHKNLSEYRRQNPDAPIWLLYYAEGYLSTGRLPGLDHNSQVLDYLRRLVASEGAKFDAVWWADELFASGGPKIFRVV